MSARRFVVITSINPPTEAVAQFAARGGDSVVVVGDEKTPSSWHHHGVHFLDIATQRRDYAGFAETLPVNQYCRKMTGYLYAMQNGAEVIVDTDDDNLPYEDWRFPPFEGIFPQLPADRGFLNLYAYYTRHNIWPRGLPLDCVKAKHRPEPVSNACRVGVWQALADLDPDVDAIYRLVSEHPDDFRFDDGPALALNEGTFAPFNSQNTAFSRSCFALLYLPVTVSFRFTDILRAWVAQPIMALSGLHLGFTKATVYQLRNPHDLMDDFADEVEVHLHSKTAVDTVRSAIAPARSMLENMRAAYAALLEEGIVAEAEMHCLAQWAAAVRPHL